MSSGSVRTEIAQFDGTNDFGLWKVKMESLLTHQGLLAAVDSTETWPEDMTESQKTQNGKKARASIFLNLSDSVLREVVSEKNPATIWTKLSELYMTKSVANRLYLKQKLFTLKMKEDTPLSKHLDAFNKIVMDLESVESKVSEEDQSLILLCSLPRSYDNLVNSLLYGRDDISMKDVKTALSNSELRKKARSDEEGTGSGFVASRLRQGSRRHSHSSGSRSQRSESRGRSERDQRVSQRSRDKSKSSRGNTRNRSQSRGKGDQDKSRVRCWGCNKRGHFQRDCPERDQSSGSDRSDSHSDEDTAETAIAEHTSDVLSITGDHIIGSWVLDSGCVHHLTPHREWFHDYRPCYGGSVCMGNDSESAVVGIGLVRIRTEDGEIMELSGVRHVPDLWTSLISLGSLADRGYSWRGLRETLTVTAGSRVVLRGYRQGDLYTLQSTIITRDSEDQRLWYSDTKVSSSRRVAFAKDTAFRREVQRVLLSVIPCAGVEARSWRPTLQAAVSACRAAEEGFSPSADQSSWRYQVRDGDPTRFRRNLVGALGE